MYNILIVLENSMAVLPITPDQVQVQDQLSESIPDEVIEAVNTLLVQNYSYPDAIIKQDAIVNIAVELMGIEQNQFNFNWLDFEDLYRDSGWDVVYNKAHYSDSYDSFFRFTKK